MYTQGRDGKAKKGEIVSIDKDKAGRLKPTVDWKTGSKGKEQVEFWSLKVDEHPNYNVMPTKGPGPMELGSGGKGKAVSKCNNCGGKGHFAKECPSNPMSGHEAQVEEVNTDTEEMESVKDDAWTVREVQFWAYWYRKPAM